LRKDCLFALAYASGYDRNPKRERVRELFVTPLPFNNAQFTIGLFRQSVRYERLTGCAASVEKKTQLHGSSLVKVEVRQLRVVLSSVSLRSMPTDI
jgi:hypothetical protein